MRWAKLALCCVVFAILLNVDFYKENDMEPPDVQRAKNKCLALLVFASMLWSLEVRFWGCLVLLPAKHAVGSSGARCASCRMTPPPHKKCCFKGTKRSSAFEAVVSPCFGWHSKCLRIVMLHGMSLRMSLRMSLPCSF